MASRGTGRESHQDTLPGRRLILVFGASGDKDVSGFLEAFASAAAHVIASRSEHPRAKAPDAIAQDAAGMGMACSSTESIEEVLEQALEMAGADDVVLVTGSVFLAGAARAVWPRFKREL